MQFDQALCGRSSGRLIELARKKVGMKKMICRIAVSSVAMTTCIYAEEAQEQEFAEVSSPTEVSSPAEQKVFQLLPLCSRVEGVAEVLLPGESTWKTVQEGYAYPLGSSYRGTSPDTRLTLAFGPESTVRLTGAGSFTTARKPLGDKTREIILGAGLVDVSLPRTIDKDAFTVSSPGFAAKNLAGDSRYTRELMPDGDKVVVRCVTGVASVEGPNFKVLPMRAAQEFSIRTSQDALATIIYGMRGDLVLDLDQGAVRQKDAETGEERIVGKTLEWRLTPKTLVRILRAVPDIGERLAVTVMTFNSEGELVNRCAFTEGRPEVNSGELEKHSVSDAEKKAGKERQEKTKSQLNDKAEGESASENDWSASAKNDMESEF
mgnify:FL=1